MKTRRLSRQRGNTMIVALMLIFLLSALSAAQFAIVQKNGRNAEFMGTHESLRQYATSGVHLAVHDLCYEISGNDGKVGTTSWTTSNDLGEDGLASTGDQGEGDGIPTPGEANLSPVTVGPTGQTASLIVCTEDSSYTDVKRIVAIAYTADTSATVESYAEELAGGPVTIPNVAAIYLPETVTLTTNGNSFQIDGTDTLAGGGAGAGPDVYGIATTTGSPGGTNAQPYINENSGNQTDNVTGVGSDPSVGEVASFDVLALFDTLKAQADQTIAASPSAHTGVTWGTSGAPLITYCDGDLKTSGGGGGYGILLVEDRLDMGGQWDWKGLVIVKGDADISGGGQGVHVYGSVLVAGGTLTIGGQSDVYYSSSVLADIATIISAGGGGYNVLYWNHMN